LVIPKAYQRGTLTGQPKETRTDTQWVTQTETRTEIQKVTPTEMLMETLMGARKEN
jgi:hypothetical protein